MKQFEKLTLPVLIAVSFIYSSCVMSNPEFFSKVQPSVDSTYGYTADNPLMIKHGDLHSSMEAERYFLQHLTTINNEKLIYVMRGSFSNPKYHSTGIENRFTHQSLGGGGPILDEYVFTVENKQDTIRLYVNVYKSEIISIPVGLKFTP